MAWNFQWHRESRILQTSHVCPSALLMILGSLSNGYFCSQAYFLKIISILASCKNSVVIGYLLLKQADFLWLFMPGFKD